MSNEKTSYLVGCIDVGVTVKQKLEDIDMTLASGKMKRRTVSLQRWKRPRGEKERKDLQFNAFTEKKWQKEQKP